MMRTRCALLISLVFGASTPEAFGSPAPPADVALGRAHFKRGVELYNSGAYAAAFAEFTRANEAAPNYRILYNLAQVQAQRQEYVAALALFQRYLAEGGDDIAPQRRRQVRADIDELQRRVARLAVEGNVAGARLFVDGQPVATLPLPEPLLLDAGVQRVRIERPGHASLYRTLTLAGEETFTLTVELQPLPRPPAPAPPPSRLPPAPPPPPPPVDRTAFWASLAPTGALTGATVTFAVLTANANARLDRELDALPSSRDGVAEARHRVRTFGAATDVFGFATAVAAGFTTYLYFSTSPRSDHAPAQQLRASIAPGASQLWWSGEF